MHEMLPKKILMLKKGDRYYDGKGLTERYSLAWKKEIYSESDFIFFTKLSQYLNMEIIQAGGGNDA